MNAVREMQTELVNCGTCSACCRRELVALIKGDDLSAFPVAVELPENVKRQLLSTLPDALGYVIPHGSDGACVYLIDGKCSVYERRPIMCRAFSCVGWVKRVLENTNRAQRRRDFKAGLITKDVWEAGRARMGTAA